MSDELIHGGDIYTKRNLPDGVTLLDFSANLNPLGMPESVRKAAAEAIYVSEAYPDPLCRELRSAISGVEKIPEDRIVCGNGAADLLYRLTWAIKPRLGLIPAPTFAEYELALQNSGAKIQVSPFPESNDFRPDASLIRSVTPDTDIVFFCNPNNPTGLTADRSYLRDLAEKCRENNSLLVVDECFLSFTNAKDEKTAAPLLEEFDNLLILKAFTKMYAMAGLRLGYLLCGSRELADRIRSSGQAWSVSTPAQAAGIAACRETALPAKTREYLEPNRTFLMNVLTECGARVYPSEANYIFFHWKDETLPERLLPFGILIRSCANYHALNGSYYRIAVRTAEENQRFAAAMRTAAQKG